MYFGISMIRLFTIELLNFTSHYANYHIRLCNTNIYVWPPHPPTSKIVFGLQFITAPVVASNDNYTLSGLMLKLHPLSIRVISKFKYLHVIIYNKPTRCNSGSIVFINNYKYALHVSDALCVHHQEHYKL